MIRCFCFFRSPLGGVGGAILKRGVAGCPRRGGSGRRKIQTSFCLDFLAGAWGRLPPLYLILTLFLFSCGQKSPIISDNSNLRIISFAPSITEILYELNLDDNIVGVTQFCKYPAQAAQKSKIGGFTNPNYEVVLRLKPNLVIILKDNHTLTQFLNKNSIRHISVGNDSVYEIIESVLTIAKACNAVEKGDSLAQRLRLQLEVSSANENRPKVLLCVGRDNPGSGSVSKTFAAGSASFYNQIIEAAGGVNVFADVSQSYPSISSEALLRFNPDIIIDISAAYMNPSLDEKTVCNDWEVFKTLSAVKNKEVHCLFGDYLTVPGPRLAMAAERFRNIISAWNQ